LLGALDDHPQPMAHEGEQRGPRLSDGGRSAGTDEPIKRLSDAELEGELTIAACTPGRHRFARYEQLLQERRRRRIAA
jgi:hypothetical protein